MFLLKLIKFICKNKHISYIQASNQPNMIGPNGLSAQHNLLKGYQAVPRLRLDLAGWHGPFHFRAVPGLVSEVISGWSGPARLVGQVENS
jgi:hypothetical protein